MGLDFLFPNRLLSHHMNRGQHNLKKWMERRGVSQREAAEIIGLHFTHLNKLLKGHRIPSLEVADRIETQTGVPSKSWLTTLSGRSASRTHTQQSNTL